MTDRYYLKTDYASVWSEVDKMTWIQVERACGFRPSFPSTHPDYMNTCATGGFSGSGHNGMICFDGRNPPPAPDPLIVKVRVYGGIVQDVETPHGIFVRVYDYDIDGAATGELDEDEDGKSCNLSVYGHAL